MKIKVVEGMVHCEMEFHITPKKGLIGFGKHDETHEVDIVLQDKTQYLKVRLSKETWKSLTAFIMEKEKCQIIAKRLNIVS